LTWYLEYGLILLKLVVASTVEFPIAWDSVCLILFLFFMIGYLKKKIGVVATWCVDVNSSG